MFVKHKYDKNMIYGLSFSFKDLLLIVNINVCLMRKNSNYNMYILLNFNYKATCIRMNTCYRY